MKQQNNQERVRTLRLPLWTYGRVLPALPYFRVLVESLREHWLARQMARRHLARLDARPGSAGIRELIARTEVIRQAELAENELNATLAELHMNRRVSAPGGFIPIPRRRLGRCTRSSSRVTRFVHKRPHRR